MGFFTRKKTRRRCRTLASFVQGIDEPLIERMTAFLLEDRLNTIQVTREFLMFVTGAGVVAYVMPTTPTRDDFDVIVLSKSWARISGTYATNTASSGSAVDPSHWDDNEGNPWVSMSDSDGSNFTNNNNNNNNNNNTG